MFVLFLFYIFTDDNVSYIVRLKSRASFVTRRIADCAVFAFLFSFLIEAVSVVAALVCFDINLILESNFLQYSALELLTLFLFYFRAGLVMLSFGIIISTKVAPIITIALILQSFCRCSLYDKQGVASVQRCHSGVKTYERRNGSVGYVGHYIKSIAYDVYAYLLFLLFVSEKGCFE